MKALIVLAATLALSLPAHALGWPSWLGFESRADEPLPPRPVVSEIVEDRGHDARWVPGVVASRTQVTMAFQTLGRMVSRPVDLGDRVEQGDVLANLASEDLAATTRAAEAALAAAEVQRDTARLALERAQALVARNVASTAQLEQAQRAAAAAEARTEMTEIAPAAGSGILPLIVHPGGGALVAGRRCLRPRAEQTHRQPDDAGDQCDLDQKRHEAAEATETGAHQEAEEATQHQAAHQRAAEQAAIGRGAGGGTVVAQGTPEEVAKVDGSFTGQFLENVLAKG